MKYLCLVFIDEKKLKALSKQNAEALDRESLAYDEVLRSKGHFVAAQALESVRSATTLRRPDGGKVLITNGPFAETTEQIGGFLLIAARDLEEATQLASQLPVLRLAAVEVRPIRELSGQE